MSVVKLGSLEKKEMSLLDVPTVIVRMHVRYSQRHN